MANTVRIPTPGGGQYGLATSNTCHNMLGWEKVILKGGGMVKDAPEKLAAKKYRTTRLEAKKLKLKAEQTLSQLENINGNKVGKEVGATLMMSGGSAKPKVNENKVGRPRGSKDQEYVDAIRQAYPPEKLLELVKVGVDIAVATGSWRGVESILTFLANYSIGKPKQRVEAGSSSALSELLAGMNTSKPLLGDQVDAAGGDGDSGRVEGNGNGTVKNESECER
jgi:hypothetical protein